MPSTRPSTPRSVRGTGSSSPTQLWEESPGPPHAALAPVRRGDGGTSRPTGCGNGLRHRPIRSSRRIMRRDVGVAPRRLAVRDGGDRGGAGRRARRIRGTGAPHRHAPTHTRGVTQGREHPAHRGNHSSGWMACAGFGDARPTARWCNGSTPALWREVRVRIPWRAPLRRITHTSGRATCTGERTLPARPADPLCDPPSDQPLPVPIPRAHRRHGTRTSSRTQPASDTTTRQEYQ